jgi:magnesium transporter
MTAPQELLERIRLRLDVSFTGIGEVVVDLPGPDLADLLNQLTLVEAATVIAMLAPPRAALILDEPDLTRRAAILEHLDAGRAAQILEGLSSDQRAEIVRHLGDRVRRRLMPKLSAESRTEVERLLLYPEKSAGGIMTTEFVRLDPGMRVGDALRHIRAVAREKESIYACYVLDPDGRLLGAVSLRDLVMGELDQPVTTVMRRKSVTAAALEDQESVAKKIAKYNLLAIPVLEQDGTVVGFVTVDDVIDVMTEEGTEDILRLAAVEPESRSRTYFENPVLRVVRKRVAWLLLLFIAGTLTGHVLRFFEDEITKVVALSFFIPLLIGTGGNAGAQTVMTIIRSLALGEIRPRDAVKVFARETGTGLLLGLLVSVAAFAQARLTGVDQTLALTVSLTMLAICVWSTAVGALIPIVAQRVGVDPAVLSAPLITTLVDATGLVIYFSIAKAVLDL